MLHLLGSSAMAGGMQDGLAGGAVRAVVLSVAVAACAALAALGRTLLSVDGTAALTEAAPHALGGGGAQDGGDSAPTGDTATAAAASWAAGMPAVAGASQQLLLACLLVLLVPAFVLVSPARRWRGGHVQTSCRRLPARLVLPKPHSLIQA